MKIVKKEDVNKVELNNLNPGEIFEYEGTLYMKIENGRNPVLRECICFDLTTDDTKTLEIDKIVVKKDTELIIK